MADKMAAVQGKVTAFIGLTKESLDGASDSLVGDREIKRRLMMMIIIIIKYETDYSDAVTTKCCRGTLQC